VHDTIDTLLNAAIFVYMFVCLFVPFIPYIELLKYTEVPPFRSIPSARVSRTSEQGG
jgi:hypothetical protein